jgi:hypothetical protein
MQDRSGQQAWLFVCSSCSTVDRPNPSWVGWFAPDSTGDALYDAHSAAASMELGCLRVEMC